MLEIYHNDPIVRSFLLFIQSADAVLKYADATFFRHNRLSLVKLMVLQVLEAAGGTLEPSNIAKQIMREPHGISTLVKRLEKDNLVTINRNEKDRRYVMVTLTDKGKALIRDTMPTAFQIVNQVMSSIPEGDAIQLVKPLKVMRKNAYEGIEKIARSD